MDNLWRKITENLKLYHDKNNDRSSFPLHDIEITVEEESKKKKKL